MRVWSAASGALPFSAVTAAVRAWRSGWSDVASAWRRELNAVTCDCRAALAVLQALHSRPRRSRSTTATLAAGTACAKAGDATIIAAARAVERRVIIRIAFLR